MIARTEMAARLEPMLGQLSLMTDASGMRFKLWQDKTLELLIQAYNRTHWRVERFQEIGWTDWTPHVQRSTHNSGREPNAADYANSVFQRSKGEAQALLEDTLDDLNETYVAGSVFSSDDTKAERPRKMFISHGRSGDWIHVQRYIERQVKFDTLELAEESSGGRTIIEKLEHNAKKCGFAIVVMTGDDSDAQGGPRVRENVMYEIGWFHARYGRENVCLLKEDGVSVPTNMSGLVYIPFAKGDIHSTFVKLREEIEAAYV